MVTTIHISDVRYFKTCRQLWDFTSSLRQNLEPRVPNRHLSGGTGFHRALERYYQPEEPFNAPATMEVFSSWRSKDWAEFLALEPDEEQITEYLALADTIEAVLKHYLSWAPSHDKFIPLGTELKFQIPLLEYNGLPVVYEGKADGLCQTKDKRFWLMEHKTCASYPQMDLLFLDEQCTSYQWAASEDPNFADTQPIGTIYTFALKRVPSIPRLLKNGQLSKDKSIRTTAGVYATEIERQGLVLADYIDILADLEERGNEFFQRVAIQRPEGALAVFESDLHSVVEDMLASPYIYPSPNWWACKTCAFRVPCSMVLNSIDPEPYLQANYQRRHSQEPEDVAEEEESI